MEFIFGMYYVNLQQTKMDFYQKITFHLNLIVSL
jgi:hypothetical protein